MTINELRVLAYSGLKTREREKIAERLLNWMHDECVVQEQLEDVFQTDISPSDLADIFYESINEYKDD